MMRSDFVKIALPKGKLIKATSSLLDEIGLSFENYHPETRIYRLYSNKLKNLSAKIFQEKDIPVQVAVGNYDMGICGADWIEELLTKYPSSSLIKLANLEYDRGAIYLSASSSGPTTQLADFVNSRDTLRIVTEYPNIAETTASNLRLRRFKIFPVWGAVEAYPPENADLVILRADTESEIAKQNLVPLKKILASSAYLIVNRESWQNKDISQIVSFFSRGLEMKNKPWLKIRTEPQVYANHNSHSFFTDDGTIRLALPDGHQKSPTIKFMQGVGLQVEGYNEDELNRRPISPIDWLNIKVIRPQDMPMQVANGNFDLAITGDDWLTDHIYRFPSSPVKKLVGLYFGKVRIVAVVSENMPVTTIQDLKGLISNSKLTSVRVASEYVSIADGYLRDNHVSPYKLIPTWGASEAFLPEDADVLIENTETGKTLAEHKLKVIDTLFHSSACVIGYKESLRSKEKKDKIAQLVEMFRRNAKGDQHADN
jgi:ATP phosphoribosyltransferase